MEEAGEWRGALAQAQASADERREEERALSPAQPLSPLLYLP